MTKRLILGALLAAGIGASAAVPFEVTTITDGKFAADTKWYTMKIHSAGYVIRTAGDTNDKLVLDDTSTLGAAADLWCFTGNDTDGYQIYNKATGTSQMLCAPSSPASDGDNGGASFAAVKAPGADGYSYVWDFSNSSNIEGSQYINLHGNSAAKLNKRGNYLAFWTSGADGGSSVMISQIVDEVEATVSGSTVTLPNGVTLSCEGGTASLADKKLTLGAGTWTMAPTEGNWILSYSLKDDQGNVVSKNDVFYTKEVPTITGPAVITRIEAVQKPVTQNGYPIFMTSGTPGYNVGYRIPSIVTVMAGPHAGRLYAVNDYRYSGADIGSGRIDLYQSYSDDNGKTWTKPDVMRNAQGNPVAQGTGTGGSVITNLDCGYGDPATVSDRETGEILMVACCGRMNFFSSRRNNPQPSARWWSKDGGETWTEPDYGQWEQIYALFDGTCPYGYIDGQFIGSGRMIQSKYIKVGSHYRIYAVMSGRNAEAGNISNWVLYSDDFGHNWHILGGGMKPGVPSNGDEPKAEELPDGSVLLAARGNGGNRNFNIFRYTDIEKAEGNWGTAINTNLGLSGSINACNGEIMILPVKNKATGEQCYMALQSYPAGPGRSNVSIAWKALTSGADFDSPEDFRTWNGHLLVCPELNSLYSTMTLQADNKIAFLYEENTYGANVGGYNEIYRPLSIEEITGDAYEYCDDADGSVRNRLTSELLHSLLLEPGKYVGQPRNGSSDAVRAMADNFLSAPSYDAVVAFNNAVLEDTDVIMPENGKTYHFISPADGTYAAQKAEYFLRGGSASLSASTVESDRSHFKIEAVEGSEGQFRIYNAKHDRYVGPTKSSASQTVGMVNGAGKAAPYTFVSDINGNTSIVCAAPGTASHPAIHLAGDFTICNWTADAGKSHWYMEEVDEEGSIEEINASTASGLKLYDLQGRTVAHPRHGEVYITNDHRKVILR